MGYAAYLVSVLGMATYMFHFWWHRGATGGILWAITAACAIFSIYAGVISGSQEENKAKRGMAMAAAIVGGILLVGLTLTAIFVLVPAVW